MLAVCFCFSSRRRHTIFDCDWSSDVCSSDLSALLCWIFWTRVHAARTHLPLLQVDRPRPDRFDKRSSHHAAELPTPAHVLADLALEQRDALRAENLALQFLQQLALG